MQASAQREVEESVRVFSELVRSIQRTQAELVLSIEEKQRQTERWADSFVAELEQEIAELKRRNADLEYVARTDHIHFLKVRENILIYRWGSLVNHKASSATSAGGSLIKGATCKKWTLVKFILKNKRGEAHDQSHL